jgi:hypothetical protein
LSGPPALCRNLLMRMKPRSSVHASPTLSTDVHRITLQLRRLCGNKPGLVVAAALSVCVAAGAA